MRVRFTPQGDRQYLDALKYIHARSLTGAATVQRRAESVIAQLSEHPHSGHVIPEFPDLPHRELPVPPYRFSHRVVDDTVWIVTVWHGHQLPDKPDDPVESNKGILSGRPRSLQSSERTGRRSSAGR